MPDALRILVKGGARRQIALLSENRLAEYYEEDEAEGTLVNAVMLGRVERVLPGMHAAFVQLGLAQNGFLPMREMESFEQLVGEKPLVTGADVLVQVKKDPKDQKGAFLTRDISLPAQYIIYMPLNRYVGVSKRVVDSREREYLADLGQELTGGAFGVILRHAALQARRQAIEEELSELKAVWEKLKSMAAHTKAPATLYRDPSVLAALVRDYAGRYALQITANDAVNRMPSLSGGVLWEQIGNVEMEALWDGARISAELSEALGRRVELRNGGSLVVDEREALTTVDVNSGKFVGDRDEEVALRQNLAACAEIARQIRLRNASGILLIDFIDMRTDEQRAQVAQRLRDELSRERVKTAIHGFTSLGLLEMTRKRTGASLRDTLASPCTACRGTGYRLEREQKQ